MGGKATGAMVEVSSPKRAPKSAFQAGLDRGGGDVEGKEAKKGGPARAEGSGKR